MLEGGEITVRINHQHPLNPSISDLDCGHDDGNHGYHDGNYGSCRERSLSLGQDLILPAVTVKNHYGEEGKKKTPPTVRGDLLAVPGEEGKRKRRRSSNARRKSIEMLNMLSNKVSYHEDRYHAGNHDNRYHAGNHDNRYHAGNHDNRYHGGNHDNRYHTGSHDNHNLLVTMTTVPCW